MSVGRGSDIKVTGSTKEGFALLDSNRKENSWRWQMDLYMVVYSCVIWLSFVAARFVETLVQAFRFSSTLAICARADSLGVGLGPLKTLFVSGGWVAGMWSCVANDRRSVTNDWNVGCGRFNSVVARFAKTLVQAYCFSSTLTNCARADSPHAGLRPSKLRSSQEVGQLERGVVPPMTRTWEGDVLFRRQGGVWIFFCTPSVGVYSSDKEAVISRLQGAPRRGTARFKQEGKLWFRAVLANSWRVADGSVQGGLQLCHMLLNLQSVNTEVAQGF
ncbi:hypothetical protein VNO80_10444 [Phaseolus coccineus]|uniref:Uncharacterized protein n=1 Tax=Phaseolus coccineus TaxID=3886 RepID=A0AAN9REM6_PHACN